MKLQSKIITIYAIAAAVISVLLGCVFYFQTWNVRFDSVRRDIASQLINIDFVLSTFFTEVGNDIETLSSNDLVRSRNDDYFTNFLAADEKTFKYAIHPDEQKIIDLFAAYQATHKYVNSVYMGRENGSFVRSEKRAIPSLYDPRARPWYADAVKNPDSVTLTEAYPSVTTSDVNIGIVRALTDKKGKVYGVVGADVTLLQLTNFISTYKTNPSGRIVLLDSDGTVLAGVGGEFLFKNAGVWSAGFQKALASSAEGMFSGTIEGRRVYAFFTTSRAYQWKIGLLVNANELERELFGQILLTLLGIMAGLLLLSILTIFALHIYVVRPLKEFIHETNYIADTTDLAHSIQAYSCDEINELAFSFNKMVKNLGSAYNKLINTKINLVKHQNNLEEVVQERTAELQDANTKLSLEIGERSQALKELVIAKRHAEESDKLKSSFLATMSHELRTPLNSIIGFTGIMLQGIAGELNDEQRKQLKMVKGSAQHLLSLINDVLDISKIEAGHLEIVEGVFDLRKTIDKTVESARPLAEKKGLALTCSITNDIEEVIGDRRRVEQILLNLISNAIKFTEKGSVAVDCSAHNGMVCIRVTDTGIGIKAEDLSSLFKPFSQIDSGISRKYEGTGLGLSISKKLVDRMDGTIQAASTIGMGSVFTVTFPLKRKLM